MQSLMRFRSQENLGTMRFSSLQTLLMRERVRSIAAGFGKIFLWQVSRRLL
jgi:hypothetical protein